jgi:uncharacterized protein with PQ loop repeat|mmetsp:Transcript_104048/g.164292  ORF Transcript_104048/g.164292 Transcript_104048/m.164292 type:complete len:300 (+) Transcript_104048:71-970(+)|eukprot:CAMPEP_0169194020 /NCGR_PEP_ID=MMETSP1016-20121227/6478_1 /TAXON_ID=342587 /ORGANISM="Karlodinium micrum, Strain CCMP2283" /LENGTH=299 /DNA_ID=CAMNT_0009270505 /DNA_START=70 /DNA_END=969 /DNA_ORIENTATION=+
MTILGIVRRHAGAVTEDLTGVGSYEFVHNFVGYGYVLAWGISFYPQLILNWRRKSTEGMSIGFQWYNVLGFMLYLIYTSFSVEATFQDQLFAAHALFVTICMLIQVPLYGTNKLGDFPPVHGKVVGVLLVFLDLAILLNLAKVISMVDLLYTCGYLKDVVSLVKYTPQLYLNWQRKSTLGFAMSMVFLDLTGGLLSIMQQLVDCQYDPTTSTMREEWTWEPLTGNKPKFFLGLIAIVYDFMFMYQYFVMYPPPSTDTAVGGNSRLSEALCASATTEASQQSPPAKPEEPEEVSQEATTS